MTSLRRFNLVLIATFAAIMGTFWYLTAVKASFFVDEEYPIWRYAIDRAETCHFRDVVILGDSRALIDTMPRLIGAQVESMAMGGASILEVYFMARRLAACPTPPKAVIIAETLLHLHDDDHFWEIAMKWGAIDFSGAEEVRTTFRAANTGLFGQAAPLDLDAKLQEALYALRFPSYFLGSFLTTAHDALRTRNHDVRKDANKTVLKRLENTRGYYYWSANEGEPGLGPEAAQVNYEVAPPFVSFFDKTIALFEDRHVPVYYITTPLTDHTLAAMKPKLLADYKAYLDARVAKHRNFHLLTEDIPTLSWILFTDIGMHLNPSGAKIWSEVLRQKMNAARVESGPFTPEPELPSK